MAKIDYYCGSFVIAARNAFEAGYYYSVFRALTKGGGFCLDYVEKFDDGSYSIQEKYSDGGHGLASALLDTMRAFGNDNPEFSEEAKNEIQRRTEEWKRMVQAKKQRRNGHESS